MKKEKFYRVNKQYYISTEAVDASYKLQQGGISVAKEIEKFIVALYEARKNELGKE